MGEELKKKLFDFIHELPQKQGEMEKLQQHCNAEQLSKQELIAEIESLKAEVSNLRTQLELTNKALHKCEEVNKGAKDAAIKHQLGLEAASRVSDKMKEEAVRLHNENIMLKKQIEQLEKETKTESFFRESYTLKQSKMQATIESLKNQMRGLEKDFRDVERNSKTARSIGNKSKLLIEDKDHTINQLKEKAGDLSTQIITLKSEMKTLQLNENRKRPVEQDYVKEILKEWQNSLNEMKSRTQSYERESETLHQSMEMALAAKIQLQKSEAAANGKVRELEAKLEDAKSEQKRNCTDCSAQTDLTISIEVGCQTARVERTDAATQSDNGEHQMKDNDGSIMKTLNNASQYEQNVPTYTSSTSTFTTSLKYSSSSVSELISRLQRERADQESEETKIQLSQSQENSELPTQLNIKLLQK